MPGGEGVAERRHGLAVGGSTWAPSRRRPQMDSSVAGS